MRSLVYAGCVRVAASRRRRYSTTMSHRHAARPRHRRRDRHVPSGLRTTLALGRLILVSTSWRRPAAEPRAQGVLSSHARATSPKALRHRQRRAPFPPAGIAMARRSSSARWPTSPSAPSRTAQWRSRAAARAPSAVSMHPRHRRLPHLPRRRTGSPTSAPASRRGDLGRSRRRWRTRRSEEFG